MLEVGFRFEASANIGIGHQRRCAVLATALESQLKARISIISKHVLRQQATSFLPPHWTRITPKASMRGVEFDLLIVDLLPHSSGEALLPRARYRLVITERPDESVRGDLIIVPSLVPVTVQSPVPLLSGAAHIILDQHFHRSCDRRPALDGRLRILACFGGSDPANLSAQVLPALQQLATNGLASPTLLLGPLYGDATVRLPDVHLAPDVTIIQGSDSVNDLFQRADLALVAGGTMMYESCYLGIATVVIAQNQVQAEEARILAAADAALYLGDGETIREEDITAALADLCQNPSKRQGLATRGSAIIDGRGVDRILNAIRALIGS
jgi:spore coat polysaccharide biosynthesis predicted glycosyltransferase SpsG